MSAVDPYSQLALLADSLDDLEAVRVATENRARSLGEYLPPGDKFLLATQALAEGLKSLEHDAVLALLRYFRATPLAPAAKQMHGVGEKTCARLLATTGDPYWNSLHGRPRTVSELWAFCGLHVLHPGHGAADTHEMPAGVDPSSNPGQRGRDDHRELAGVAPSRSKGQKANWSATAKMRSFLVADAAVKAGVRKLDYCDDTDGYDLAGRKAVSPLGQVYLDGRNKYADATHAHECRRCGPKGKPAGVGSPLSDGHKHARAMRLVMKQVLKDLWQASRDAHHPLATQEPGAVAGPADIERVSA